MIHNDVLSQLQLLIKTSAPPLLEVSQQQLALPQLTPGQKVPAHVVANLPNGRFQVLIADKSLDMNLPKNTLPGDSVELVFVTSKPRLTFILAKDLANIATNTNGANPKPQVSLSETARFLGGLLEKAAQPQSAQARASSIAQSAPLLAGAPVKTADFAQSLRGALTQSGLFYESHQAQWVSGQRPVTDLLREPQGRLSPAMTNFSQPGAGSLETATSMKLLAEAKFLVSESGKGQPGLGAPGNANPFSPAAMANARPSELQAASLPQDKAFVKAEGGVNTAAGTAAVKSTGAQQTSSLLQNQNDVFSGKPLAMAPAHPETLPIIRQQLDALDTRQVMWQGQVWPGQTMDWRIEERAAREQESGDIEQQEWQTSLRLVLPQLGEINARLILHPQGMRIQLGAAEFETVGLLTEERPALQQGMESSGLKLAEIKVSHETAG